MVRPLINAGAVAAWARAAGFTGLAPQNWHVTICNSRTRIDTDALVADHAELVVPASSDRLVIRLGYEAEFVALAFRSSALATRHLQFRAAGAGWDHHRYQPHVTFAVADRRALDGIEPFDGPLVFRGEVWSNRTPTQ